MGSKTGYSVGKEKKKKKKRKLGGVDQNRRRQRSWAVHSHWGIEPPSVTPALGRLKHDCCEVKPSLGYL